MVTEPRIDSPANARVKAWRALRKRSARGETGTFLIEGEREVRRALDHVEIIESIVRADRSTIDLPNTTLVSARVFDHLSARQHPDGIAAIARTPDLGLENLELPRSGLVLVGDGIEKPGNIGAMLRSADAFGAAFIGSALSTDVVNPNVVRAAQGSLYATAVAVAERSEAIAWCVRNTTVVLAVADGGPPPWDVDLGHPTSVVIGSEHAGIDPAWMGHGDPSTIPTSGTADSLNASVAAAVFLAEATRQRSS
jgi:RNA methyltransferase, TrmH family